MSNPDYSQLAGELEEAERELARCRKNVTEIRRRMQPDRVTDYQFRTPEGDSVSLLELFGDKEDLIIIHNMGKTCPYCTLWADGFNGVYRHLENRAGFAVVSPDPPDIVREFAGGRGWKFRVLSNNKGSFTKAMGYESEKGEPRPGISTFHREPNGTIRRITHASFGPGDDFCAVWHIFDMLEKGPDGWKPKFSY